MDSHQENQSNNWYTKEVMVKLTNRESPFLQMKSLNKDSVNSALNA